MFKNILGSTIILHLLFYGIDSIITAGVSDLATKEKLILHLYNGILSGEFMLDYVIVITIIGIAIGITNFIINEK